MTKTDDIMALAVRIGGRFDWEAELRAAIQTAIDEARAEEREIAACECDEALSNLEASIDEKTYYAIRNISAAIRKGPTP